MDLDSVRYTIAVFLLIVAAISALAAKLKKIAFYREMFRPYGRAPGSELKKAANLNRLAVCLVIAAAVFAWPEGLSFR